MMMATVLVALMAFAVQSCGSDDKDDLSSSPYEIAGAFNLQQKGNLDDKDVATLKEKFANPATVSTAVFTITITTTNLKTKKQVCKWDIEWNKGSVSSKKY